MRKVHAGIASGALALALMMSGGAWAQSPDTPADGGNAASQDDDRRVSLHDIVVTAQKMRSSLQKTIGSIAAIDGDRAAKEGKGTLNEILRDTAGVQLMGTGASGQGFFVSIRGVGFAPVFGQDSPVTVSLNGVFQQRAQSTRALFYDIARVEVVRGPDSTLNGRNAEGGSVTVIANDPSHKFEASGTLEAGNYDLFAGQAMVNIPIGQTLALRAAVSGERRDGYLSNGGSDSHVLGGRVRALWEPSSDFKVILTADYARQTGLGQQQSASGLIDLTGAVHFPNGYWTSANPSTGFRHFNNGNYYADITANLGFAELYIQPTYNRSRYNLESNTFSLLTYQTRLSQALASGHANANGIASALASTNGKEVSRQDQKTLEVRLSSPASSPVKWLVGGYFLDNKEDTSVNMQTGTGYTTAARTTTLSATAVPATAVVDPGIAPPAFYSEVSPHREVRDYAGFAQVTVPLTERLRVIAGGRYTRERKLRNEQVGNICVANSIQTSTCATSGSGALNGTRINTTLFYLLDNGVAGTTTNNGEWSATNTGGNRVYFSVPEGRAVFERADYKLSLQYDVSPTSNVYGLVSSGFKSGGFINLPPASSGLLNPGFRNTFDPESLTSFEIGMKNDLLDRKWRLNVSAFVYDYRDYQFSYAAQVFNPNATLGYTTRKVDPDFTTTITANAARARSFGGEVESTLILSDHDRFTMNISYLHARFRKVNLAGGTAATVTFGDSLKGFALPRSPSWTIIPGYSHVFDVGKAGTLVASVDGHFETESNLAIPSNAAALAAGYYEQPSFMKVNASLAFNPAKGNWGITAYVRNIGNVGTLQSITVPTAYTNTVPVFGALNQTNIGFEAADPRTYGVTVTARF
ncbi:TonB-dependent receptor [Sphingobium sp.]|uniref:TonB-dependent receptor n=1 Tax=Sphingobium sp. TaxID=1912891 RepID=UPI0028BEF53E|nr:TonB-dependent receptor [Sphingobium sp.]